MATIKCYSGGKCVKTFKNIEEDDIEQSELYSSSYQGGSAIGHGFQITEKKDSDRYLVFDWRGDFSIEW
jgi:hypothetical protein